MKKHLPAKLVQAQYAWLSPAQFGQAFAGMTGAWVIKQIHRGAFDPGEVEDVRSHGSPIPRYRIRPDALDRFRRERSVQPESEAA